MIGSSARRKRCKRLLPFDASRPGNVFQTDQATLSNPGAPSRMILIYDINRSLRDGEDCP